MSRSSFVEVNITNSTRLAQDSQNTADTAVKGVTDLNDPNLMSVIEKQNNVVQFAGLTSQYNVVIQNANDEGINTDSLTTAYNNLNKFMIDVLTDPDHASDVDRKTYKNYQDTYNSELAKIQTALKNNTDGKFTSAASATSQAASTASQAFSQAQSTADYANSQMDIQSQATANAQSTADNAYSYANSQIAVQSQATVKAQSTADNAFSQAIAVGSQASAEISNNSQATVKAQSKADNAFSQAQTAIDNGKATSQAITDLKDGSKLTIAQLENGLATKVANSEYASYKLQTASQIAQKVSNSAFSTYQTQTATLISSKVATKDFSAYQATTAKAIDSKVDNGDFNTYKTQTADLIDDKVSSSEYASDKTQTASEIADRVSNSAFSTYQTQTANLIASKVDNGAFSTYKTQTAGLIAQKVATKDFSAYQSTTDKAIESKVNNGDFSTYKTQTAKLIDDKVSSSAYSSDRQQTASQIAQKVSNSAFSTYQTQTATLISSKVATKDFSAYQATTDKAIESKVESSAFNSYKTQTDKAIISKVSVDDFKNLTISNRNLALGTATALTMTGNNTANQVLDCFSTSKTITKGTTITVSFDIVSTNTTGTFVMQFSGGSWQSVTVNYNNPLTTDVKHYSCTLVTDSDFSDVVQLRLDNATGTVTVSNFIISESSKEVSWTPAPEDQANQSQITQLSGDIDLRVRRDGLISEINLQAGKDGSGTLISSSGQLTLSGKTVYFDTADPVIIPSANMDSVLVGKKLTAADISANTFTTNNGTFTVDSNGNIVAKNMTLNGGTLFSPTINASTINGSIINGTTFNAGTKLNQYGNTNYPLTINPDGSVTSTSFDTVFNTPSALRTFIKDGTVKTNFRGMTPFASGMYLAADTALGAGQLSLYEGYSTSQDPNFTASGLKSTGYVILDAGSGLNLHGDTQQIHFNGTSADTTPKGIAFTPYGNINATGTQGTWYIGNNSNMLTASWGIDNQNKNYINFYRPLFVDEIGAISSSNGGALFLHGQNNSTGQILLKKDSTGPQVLSASIYNRTYSGGSTVTVTGVGTLGRITSASKYKLAIAREPQVESADRLLTIDPSSWVDLEAAKAVARNKSNGEALLEHEQSLNRYHGMIAEDLRDAGLDEFVIYGKNGEIEGIQYDRLWTVLIPKIKQLNERLNELERKSI